MAISKEARALYSAKYYAENKEKYKAYALENRARYNEHQRAWRSKNKEKVYKSILAYQARNPDKVKAWRFANGLKKYGLTPEMYEAMLAQQGGVCAGCGGASGSKRLCVDHDHATGAVRSILCTNCNVSIAQGGDDPERLILLAAYLRKHGK